MKDKRKIKELYDCKYIISDEELYPIQKWYNRIIDKTTDEITIADILRMIRQKEFCDLAVEKAVEFLRDNVFAGETYDGELLEKISEMSAPFLTKYANELKYILKDAMGKSEMHQWSWEGEREEFKTMVNTVLKKIK